MKMPGLKRLPKNGEMKYIGYAHLSISVGSKEHVDSITNQLEKDGYEIYSQPRLTGDGYYESCVFDPEGNLIEVTI